MDAYRGRLLAVRHGEIDWSQVSRWRDELTARAEDRFGTTILPAAPNRARAERFLIEVRRRLA
jgi:hypothetical protein